MPERVVLVLLQYCRDPRNGLRLRHHDADPRRRSVGNPDFGNRDTVKPDRFAVPEDAESPAGPSCITVVEKLVAGRWWR